MSGWLLRIVAAPLLLLAERTLLDDYKQALDGSAAQNEAVLKEREQSYAQAPTDQNRMRLAIALGFGKGTAVDTRRALQLFDDESNVVGVLHSDDARLAGLFAAVLRERLQNAVKVADAAKQMESERLRADELQKKLDALKSIEKSLRKR